jgi:xanthine dehydrogenase accessory factor
MADTAPNPFFAAEAQPYAIILGLNEIASAVAVGLCWEGFHVVMSHDPFPPVIRRRMSFHDALFEDRAEVDGIIGVRAETALEIVEAFSRPGRVAVSHSPLTDLITLRAPQIVVDARMQKHRVTPDLRGVAPLAIGVGPQFVVGDNCDIAVETHPQQTGALVETGETRTADGVARLLGGVGRERFVYATRDGLWRTPLDVGAQIFKGYLLGYLDGAPIRAPRDGYLRGIARDGAFIPANCKIVEVDPRGRDAVWTGTDERGRTIAAAVILAIDNAPAHRKPFTRIGVTIH